MFSWLKKIGGVRRREGGFRLGRMQEMEARIVLSAPGIYGGVWRVNNISTEIMNLDQPGGKAKVTGTFANNEAGPNYFSYDVKGRVHGSRMVMKGKGTDDGVPAKVKLVVELTANDAFEGSIEVKTGKVKTGPSLITAVHG